MGVAPLPHGVLWTLFKYPILALAGLIVLWLLIAVMA